MQLSADGRALNGKFHQAYVAFPIISADFLANFKMAVDLSGMQLFAPAGLKIPLEAPQAGSLTAAAIRVISSLYTLTSRRGGTSLFSYTSHSGGTWRKRSCRGGNSATLGSQAQPGGQGGGQRDTRGGATDGRLPQQSQLQQEAPQGQAPGQARY